jgi:hypothetical protein
MALTASSKTRKLVPVGNYQGVIVGVYDIGTQPSEKYEPSHQIIVSFELHKRRGPVLDDEGRPVLLNRYLGLGLGINRTTGRPSQTRQVIEACIGRSLTPDEAKSYDVLTLVGKCCQIGVMHTEDGSKEIPTYTPLDEDDPTPKAQGKACAYEMTPGRVIPDAVPDWIQKTVEKSLEWTRAAKSAETMQTLKEDSPF